MIGRIVIFACLLVLGASALIAPELLRYMNTGSWFFDVVLFLRDHPDYKLVFGIPMVLIGVGGVLFFVTDIFRGKVAFVIHRSAMGDYGNSTLSFPRIAIGTRDVARCDIWSSIKNPAPAVLSLDKKQIRRFYEYLLDKKRIAFLAVAPFPFLVYAGYIVGNSGQKVSFFHYNRAKARSEWVRPGVRTLCSLNVAEINSSPDQSSGMVVAVSVSYPIERSLVEQQFSGQRILYLDCSSVGTDVIKNRKTLDSLSNQIVKTISESSGQCNEVTLLLSCPAVLCFSLGQRLCSPGLPTIRVYNYDRSAKSDNWNWSIKLDRTDE